MVLTVHHLQRSQSERIVWLCEELQIPYELKLYQRSPLLSPPELKAISPIGAAPLIDDEDPVSKKNIRLAESAAIVEYIINKHGNGHLALGSDHPDYADYLYWFHFTNGSLQPALGRVMVVASLNVDDSNPMKQNLNTRLEDALKLVDERVKKNTWLAGKEFTAADVMIVFSFTTMRLFTSLDLSSYPGILSYLKRIGERKAYKTAMEKGDPGMKPLLGAESPELFEPLRLLRSK